MTDPDLVARKLAVIRDHVARLRRRRPDDIEELRRDEDRLDALAMSVLVVVQEAIDIAFHMAADEGWGLPASYRESFELLARNGVIDAPLAAALARASRPRNRLAHGYATVDLDRLWSELPDGIASFEQFTSAVARHLHAKP